MLNTVEMRWFFDDCPLDEQLHFANVGELQTRTDWYSMPSNPACGIKVREGRFESKLRTGQLGERTFAPLAGHLEQWRKWSLDYIDDTPPSETLLAEVGWISVAKRRRLKRFSVDAKLLTEVAQRPSNGCEFELTEVDVRGQTYWTVGFEAVGEPERLEENLRVVAQEVVRTGGMRQEFVLANSFGYAQWLSLL